MPGRELDAVVSGLDILSAAANGAAFDCSEKSVAVIGGGNTAVDCALLCRLGGASEVRIICLENPHQMPAYKQELREAKEAGSHH